MGAEAAVIAAQMIANAIKASGTVVRIEPDEFAKILKKIEGPLVVYAEGGMISTNHQYLVTKASPSIPRPTIQSSCRVAQKLWWPRRSGFPADCCQRRARNYSLLQVQFVQSGPVQKSVTVLLRRSASSQSDD